MSLKNNLSKEELARVRIWLDEQQKIASGYDILGDIEPCDVSGW